MRKRGAKKGKKQNIVKPRKTFRIVRIRTKLIPASLLKRMVAFIIDLLIIRFVIFMPFVPYLEQFVPKEASLSATFRIISESAKVSKNLAIIMLLLTILVLAYFTFFEWALNQTPGKMLVRIYKIAEAAPEQKMLLRYLLSNMILIPFFPFYLLWVIDPLYALFSPKNQRLTEKFAKIITVERAEV